MRWKALPVLVLLFAGCSLVPFVYPEHSLRDKQLIDPRTALVIDNHFQHWNNPERSNNFYFQATGEIDADALFEDYINPLDEAMGHRFAEETAEYVFTAFSGSDAPDVGLDTSRYFESGNFPVIFPDEIYKGGSIFRDYSGLVSEGYTHVLSIGFTNAYDASADLLAFGFYGVLYDIRNGGGAGEPIETRAERAAWRYYIYQSPQSSTTTATYVNPFYGTSYGVNADVYSTTYHHTTSTRHCLNVALIHDNGEPCTIEELFNSDSPLYLEIYKRAALSNLLLAINHMKYGERGEVQRLVNVDDLLRAPLPWETVSLGE